MASVFFSFPRGHSLATIFSSEALVFTPFDSSAPLNSSHGTRTHERDLNLRAARGRFFLNRFDQRMFANNSTANVNKLLITRHELAAQG
jgi:hypothetical protein